MAGKRQKARTWSLRDRRAIHRLRADAATARRAAERADSPATSVSALHFDQLIPATEETLHAH